MLLPRLKFIVAMVSGIGGVINLPVLNHCYFSSQISLISLKILQMALARIMIIAIGYDGWKLTVEEI